MNPLAPVISTLPSSLGMAIGTSCLAEDEYASPD
jgi:hypothetical protein